MENLPYIHLLSDFSGASPRQSIYLAHLASAFPQLRTISSNQVFKKGDMMAPGIFLKLLRTEFP
ncbi:MAG: hypothetical protein KG003_09055, partial [Bacteroidetes bacterium]|nr:hypothetical protein [Bacteroidota bacterium]